MKFQTKQFVDILPQTISIKSIIRNSNMKYYIEESKNYLNISKEINLIIHGLHNLKPITVVV